MTHDLDIVFVVRLGNKDPYVRRGKKSLNNLISSPEPKNIQYQVKIKIQTEKFLFCGADRKDETINIWSLFTMKASKPLTGLNFV